MSIFRDRPSDNGDFPPGGPGWHRLLKKNPWKWLSIVLSAVVVVLLLLLDPCGSSRCPIDRGVEKSETDITPATTIPETPPASPRPTVRKRIYSRAVPHLPSGTETLPEDTRAADHKKKGARSETSVPAVPAVPDTLSETALPVDHKKNHVSAPEKNPEPDAPLPRQEEETDFRTRLEIITEPSK